MNRVPSYANITQVIEALMECVNDQIRLVKKGIDRKGFDQASSDHYELSRILSNGLNNKFYDLIKDKEANEITESEYKRHLIKFDKLLTSDVRIYAPVLQTERIEVEVKKYLNNSDRKITTDSLKQKINQL